MLGNAAQERPGGAVAEPPIAAAVVWIGPGGARVASRDTLGVTSVHEVPVRSDDPDDVSGYLADVVDAIGAARRVVVLGPADMRLDLEREFVAIGHHPERIADAGPSAALDDDALLERLAALEG
jgi:hypothetical protein